MVGPQPPLPDSPVAGTALLVRCLRTSAGRRLLDRAYSVPMDVDKISKCYSPKLMSHRLRHAGSAR
jgi:hypothetical protein